jgi:hypothetical protein
VRLHRRPWGAAPRQARRGHCTGVTGRRAHSRHPSREREGEKERGEGGRGGHGVKLAAGGGCDNGKDPPRPERADRAAQGAPSPSISLSMPQAEHLSPPQMLPPALRHAPLPSVPSLPLSLSELLSELCRTKRIRMTHFELMSAQPRHSAQ